MDLDELDRPERGFFWGTVEDNLDPRGKHRVRVSVAGFYDPESPSPWALPIGLAGLNSGVWNVPPIGTNVKVEFQHGDPQYPVYQPGPYLDGHEPASIQAVRAESTPEELPEALTQVRAVETRDWELFVDERPGRSLFRIRAKDLGAEDPDGTSLMLEMDGERGILALSAPGGVSIQTRSGRISIDGLLIDIGGRTVLPASSKPI